MNALLRRAPGRRSIIFLKVTLDETWTEQSELDQIDPNWSKFVRVFLNLSSPGPARSCGSLVEIKMS